MKALVLSGGGFKGSYQVGVFKALKKLNYKFDIITGTSIGALNGALIVSNQYKKLLELWKNVKIDFVFTDEVDEEHLVLEYAKNIIENKGMNVDALEQNIKKYLSTKKFFNSNINYGLVTVNKKTLKPKYLTKKELNKDNLADYLIASATFFPVFRSKKINDEEYVDGGFYDNMPINLAIQLGANEIIAVDLEAIGVKRKIEGKAKITYIRPNNKLGPIMSVDPKQIKKNIDYGYNDTMKVFKLLEGKKYTFKKGELDKYYHLYKEKYELVANKKKKGTILTKTELRKILENAATILNIDETKIYTIKKLNNIIKKEANKQNCFKSELKKINKKALTLSITDKIAIYLSII